MNQGTFAEFITIVAYVNLTVIGTRTLGYMLSKAQTTLTLVWNMTGYAKGAETVWAYSTPNLDEANLTDNTIQNGILTVVMIGDIKADGKVDLEDVYVVDKAYSSTRDQPKYNPNLDTNEDYKIDLKDYYIVCKNYGKTDP